MGTCTEVSVQAAQIGCLDADFRQHVHSADIELSGDPVAIQQPQSSARLIGQLTPTCEEVYFLQARGANVVLADLGLEVDLLGVWRTVRAALPYVILARARTSHRLGRDAANSRS